MSSLGTTPTKTASLPKSDANESSSLHSIWLLKSLTISLIASFTFSCAPAIWFNEDVQLPPAYALKAEQPLADTSQLTVPENIGERSHGAKLTSRLVGSFYLYFASGMNLHPYLAATLGGACVLLSGLVVGFRITEDRYTAAMLSLVLAGSYTSNACFSINHTVKPFDGIALGLLAIATMAAPKPTVMAIFCFLACWTDERAFVAMFLIGVFLWIDQRLGAAKKRLGISLLIVASLVYVVTRIATAQWLGWNAPDTSLLVGHFRIAVCYWQVALWSLGDGLILLVLVGLWAAWQRKQFSSIGINIGCVFFSVASALIVLDLSRATAFAFPLVFIAAGTMHANLGSSKNTIRLATASAAILSLLSNNVEVIASITYTPLPSTPVILLYRLFLLQ